MHVGYQMAILEIRTHLFRSLLSVTGVTLGVASLVAMLSLLGGLRF